ncbi:MFS transporter [Haladaptatus sp. CMSO5]|uniref:MFS transporter n=1 Tax=Haladaptatus sp. CMSO5 TaxID=3120514 RepID=UPI002FCE410A
MQREDSSLQGGPDRLVIGLVSGGHFLAHFYALAFPPLFPLLIDEFALSNTELGLLMSVMALSTFILQIPVGVLVDRVGAKRVFIVGLVLVGGGTMLAGLAGSYLYLLAAVFVVGIGQSAFHPADFALLDAATSGAAEGKSFAFHTFSGYTGFAVAPFVVGGLGVTLGWQPALLIVGAVGVVYALVSQLSMRPLYRLRMAGAKAEQESSGPTESRFAAVTKLPILLLFAFFITVTMANKGVHTFTGVFLLSEFSLDEFVGNAALTSYFTLTAIGVLVGGALADRYRATTVIATVLVLAGLSTFATVAGVLPMTAEVAVALFAVVGLFYGLALPSRDRLINSFSTDSTTGQSFGFVYTGLPLGAMVSPVVLGVVIDFWDAKLAFAAIGALFLLSSAIGVISGMKYVTRSTSRAAVKNTE